MCQVLLTKTLLQKRHPQAIQPYWLEKIFRRIFCLAHWCKSYVMWFLILNRKPDRSFNNTLMISNFDIISTVTILAKINSMNSVIAFRFVKYIISLWNKISIYLLVSTNIHRIFQYSRKRRNIKLSVVIPAIFIRSEILNVIIPEVIDNVTKRSRLFAIHFISKLYGFWLFTWNQNRTSYISKYLYLKHHKVLLFFFVSLLLILQLEQSF